MAVVKIMQKQVSTRKDMLDAAANCVCNDRENVYGKPENSFKAIAAYWTDYIREKTGTDITITNADVPVMMALFKIARITTAKKFSADSFVDGAGYLACACEIKSADDEENA